MFPTLNCKYSENNQFSEMKSCQKSHLQEKQTSNLSHFSVDWVVCFRSNLLIAYRSFTSTDRDKSGRKSDRSRLTTKHPKFSTDFTSRKSEARRKCWLKYSLMSRKDSLTNFIAWMCVWQFFGDDKRGRFFFRLSN